MKLPPPFALGLFALGMALMVVPELRIAGVIALVLALAYWVLMVVTRLTRR
jgi:hypothetical protein